MIERSYRWLYKLQLWCAGGGACFEICFTCFNQLWILCSVLKSSDRMLTRYLKDRTIVREGCSMVKCRCIGWEAGPPLMHYLSLGGIDWQTQSAVGLYSSGCFCRSSRVWATSTQSSAYCSSRTYTGGGGISLSRRRCSHLPLHSEDLLPVALSHWEQWCPHCDTSVPQQSAQSFIEVDFHQNWGEYWASVMPV